jgi:hypothetical protein
MQSAAQVFAHPVLAPAAAFPVATPLLHAIGSINIERKNLSLLRQSL